MQALLAAQPGFPWAANLRALLDLAPPLEPWAGEFRDDLSRDVRVAPRQGATTVLITFCGARHRLGMPLPLIHRWLARLPAHLIYLRDFHSLCYLKGVASLGDLDASVAALRVLLDELGARRVVCFGCSGGGYGALRYALELGGDAVSMGSPVSMEPEFNARMNHLAAAQQMKAAFPDEDLDLRRRFDTAARPPRTLIVYGEKSWNERIHAEHMAGGRGAALSPVAGYAGHDTAAELIRRGELEPMLQDFLACRPLGHNGVAIA
jgi:pimeloyl-ACP methyl ester carboxylesterase